MTETAPAPARAATAAPLPPPLPAQRNRLPTVFVADVAGRPIRFNTADPHSRRWFFPRYDGGRLHEPAATGYLVESLSRSSVFLDVGASLGWFSMVAAAFAREVFAVEPQAFQARRIRMNAAANGFDNVNILLAAAGEAPGFVRMPELGSPSSAVDGGSGARVPLVRLDDHFGGEIAPDVVKIDVEGYEWQVLRGMEGLLRRGSRLMVELHASMTRFGATPRAAHDFLKDHGYRIRTVRHREAADPPRDVRSADFDRLRGTMMIVCER